MERIIFGAIFFALAVFILKVLTHGKSDEELAKLREPREQAARIITAIGFIVVITIALAFFTSLFQ